jgi:hypothetical protein
MTSADLRRELDEIKTLARHARDEAASARREASNKGHTLIWILLFLIAVKVGAC